MRPAWADGWWALGSIYYDQDRFSEAEPALKHFVASAPRPGPAYAFLGLCEYETRDYARAIEHFQKWALEGSPGNRELIDVASFHWALLLTREGHFTEALFLFAAKAERLGVSPALAEAMGLASLHMKYLPEEYPPERREIVWLAGETALYGSLQTHDFDRANEYARRLELHYDQEPNVHYFLGTQYGFQKDNAKAAEEYREELQISPGHVPAMIGLATIDLEGANLDEAASLAERAIQIEPKDAEAHHTLGRALLAKGQLAESARELETAKQLAPYAYLIRLHLTTVYRRLGRNKEAEQEMEAFTKLKSNSEALLSPEQLRDLLREQPEKPK